MATKYYTRRSQAPLAFGETIAFTRGKGYYAKPAPGAKPPKKPDPVAAFVTWWLWAIKNRGRIAYSQGGHRLDGEKLAPGTLPLETDCSGLTFTLADWAGLKLIYNGSGNTDTLASECDKITIAEAKPGDLIEYGNGERTEHVVAILERLSATDFDCGSHGSVANPCHHVTHSAEAAYQASVGYSVVTFRRIPEA